MGRYLDGKTPMGPNVKKLFIRFVSVEAIPAGGSFAAGLDFLMNPERMKAGHQKAMQNTEAAIEAMRAAPDNPFGDDDEAIAAGILRHIEERKV